MRHSISADAACCFVGSPHATIGCFPANRFALGSRLRRKARRPMENFQMCCRRAELRDPTRLGTATQLTPLAIHALRGHLVQALAGVHSSRAATAACQDDASIYRGMLQRLPEQLLLSLRLLSHASNVGSQDRRASINAPCNGHPSAGQAPPVHASSCLPILWKTTQDLNCSLHSPDGQRCRSRLESQLN